MSLHLIYFIKPYLNQRFPDGTCLHTIYSCPCHVYGHASKFLVLVLITSRHNIMEYKTWSSLSFLLKIMSCFSIKRYNFDTPLSAPALKLHFYINLKKIRKREKPKKKLKKQENSIKIENKKRQKYHKIRPIDYIRA